MQLLLHQTHSEEDDLFTEEEEDAGTPLELPVLEAEMGDQDLEQPLVIRQEEFSEVDRGEDDIKGELTNKKVGENILLCICML